MTLPVSNNEALVPRRQIRSEDFNDDYECNETTPFVSYAPPGAAFRARVRHLGDNEIVEKVSEIQTEDIPVPDTHNSRQIDEEDSETNLVIKIEAEVSLKGSIPAKGMVIETITHVRPGN